MIFFIFFPYDVSYQTLSAGEDGSGDIYLPETAKIRRRKIGKIYSITSTNSIKSTPIGKVVI